MMFFRKESAPRQYIVSEYMSAPVIVVSEEGTLREAISRMRKHKTNTLVVVHEGKKVAGIVTILDILRHIVPDYLEGDKRLASFEPSELFTKRIHEVGEDPVSKFMVTKVVTVKPDDTLTEATTLLSEFRVHQLPVVDKDGVLVGYISRTDIKRAIGEVFESDRNKS